MTNDKFIRFAKEKFDKQLQILGSKGAEYSQGVDDRFLNFKMAGAIQGMSAREALLGQLSKHLASIIDMIKSPIKPSQMSVWAEKTGDAINYLVLLEAMVNEEVSNSARVEPKPAPYPYGKSMQIGEPTPDNPMPITSNYTISKL